jgi:hypothetical protein
MGNFELAPSCCDGCLALGYMIGALTPAMGDHVRMIYVRLHAGNGM